MSVCLCTHSSVRGEQIHSQVLECGIALRAWLLSATTVRWQKRNGHYTEIANQLRGSVQGGLQAQPAGGLQPGAAQILTGSSAARNLQVGAERDRHLCHILQGKVSNNCRNQTQRRAIERSTREQFEALSEEFTHHRANQNSCCG